MSGHAVQSAHRGLRLRGPLRVAGLLGGLALACGVALTATSGWLIVQASTHPVVLSLLTAIVGVRTFGIGRPVFRYAERLRSHDAAMDDLARARVETYRRLIPLTPARLGRGSRSDVLSAAVKDLDDEVEAQVRVVMPLVSAAIAGAVGVAVAAVVWLPVAAVIGVLVLALAALVRGLAVAEDQAQREGLAARAEAARVSALVTSNARELQAISAQERTAAWLATAHARVCRAAARQGRVRAVGAALVLVCVGAATLVTALLVRPHVGRELDRPLAALLLLIPLALAEVTAPLPEAMGALARSRAAAQRLHTLVDQRPAVAGAITPGPEADRGGIEDVDARADATADAPEPTAAPPRLELKALTAGWTDRRIDVGPVDLAIAPGEHLALVGASGAGKSTLLAVLARQLDPHGGRYLVDGQDALTLPLDGVRDRIAVVDDEPHLFASTLRNNLTLARPGADDADCERALRAAGLGRWWAGLPEGLDTRIGHGGVGVSGGERARLAIARALLSRRPVIVLDEPVAHLDHPTAVAVLADLFDAGAGRTIIMVSHRDEGTARCDRVVEVAASSPASRQRPQTGG